MSIFSKLFRSRDKPTDSTNGSGYRYYFGGTTSGKAVNERSAMQISAVYACVRVLSEAIASLPLHLYNVNFLRFFPLEPSALHRQLHSSTS